MIHAFWWKTNTTSMFISMIPMIFIFGFAKKYLLEKKLGHFEKSFRARVANG